MVPMTFLKKKAVAAVVLQFIIQEEFMSSD